MAHPAPPRSAFYALFILSGFAGLIYESIWTHYLKLYLGHAAYAQSLVLIVFMGGMALGSALCARWSERIAHPLLGYALVEAIIGLCALGFHETFVAVTDWSHAGLLPLVADSSGAVLVKLALASALILPQSILLGATFPLMSAGLVRSVPRAAGESIAMLYFSNSLGAALGVLASGFVLIAAVGLPGTLRTAGLLNLALAACVALVARPLRAAPVVAAATSDGGARILVGVAFFTGLASFIYEISWIRMLSLVLGASTHAFELMLSTFIFGLALGGLAARRLAQRTTHPGYLLAGVQLAMGLLALATLPVYDWSFDWMAFLMKGLARTESGYVLFNFGGQALAAAVMLPTTLCAGMTLPLLTAALFRGGSGEGAIGRVYAANTVGAIAGVLIAVHLGLPMLGLKHTLVLGAAVDLALGIALLWRYAPRPHWAGWAAIACLPPLLAASVAFQLDPNKMTAGVFRYGDLSASEDANILYARDGKTATVHLVGYPEATSLRTNGKSDGSIAIPGVARGTDEITMVLTGALPLALKPETKTAAVIGIGTGLTMHTLLQSLAITSVETVEIEPAMAEAARGFSPRNLAAFADPRGRILFDDAKTFFSTHSRRYDLIISEPSNPWVSGVASLFTQEFYRRVHSHLNPRGLLVQWFQLYEIDAALLASVMQALGSVFPHYAIYAPSDHDLLIVAGDQPIAAQPSARVFREPHLAAELAKIHVHAPGDLDARYLGSRATLEPLFASYGVPANSDYFPLLDLYAAKHRFLERSATDVVALMNLRVPVLEVLEPVTRRAPDPGYPAAYAFQRLENMRLARYARDFLLDEQAPTPQAITTQLQKDLEIVRLRLIECSAPQTLDVWLHALLRVAGTINPHSGAAQATAVWQRITGAACFATLRADQRKWIELFAATGRRDARTMADLGSTLLAEQAALSGEARELLLLSSLAGLIGAGARDEALRLWHAQAPLSGTAIADPAFRLLRCHAGPGPGCAGAFEAYRAL